MLDLDKPLQTRDGKSCKLLYRGEMYATNEDTIVVLVTNEEEITYPQTAPATGMYDPALARTDDIINVPEPNLIPNYESKDGIVPIFLVMGNSHMFLSLDYEEAKKNSTYMDCPLFLLEGKRI